MFYVSKKHDNNDWLSSDMWLLIEKREAIKRTLTVSIKHTEKQRLLNKYREGKIGIKKSARWD